MRGGPVNTGSTRSWAWNSNGDTLNELPVSAEKGTNETLARPPLAKHCGSHMPPVHKDTLPTEHSGCTSREGFLEDANCNPRFVGQAGFRESVWREVNGEGNREERRVSTALLGE